MDVGDGEDDARRLQDGEGDEPAAGLQPLVCEDCTYRSNAPSDGTDVGDGVASSPVNVQLRTAPVGKLQSGIRMAESGEAPPLVVSVDWTGKVARGDDTTTCTVHAGDGENAELLQV